MASRFAVCRTISKYLIATHIKRDIEDIVFSYSELGKPYIKNYDLYFNISHSNDLGILVLHNCSKVGIDIEFMDESINHFEIVESFSTCEISWVKENNSLERFYKLWTAKEAIFKCYGTSQYYLPQLKIQDGDPFYSGTEPHYLQYNYHYITLCIAKTSGDQLQKYITI
mgnify:FL=1